MKDNIPRSVLITGGAVRVGRHLALALGEAGWDVHLHYRSKAAEAEDAAHQIHRSGGQCWLHQADLADPDAAEALINALPVHDGVMALINNASLFELDTAENVSAAMINIHMAVNMTAPALMIKTLAARIEPHFPLTRGVAINITDAKLSGLNPDYFSYTLSKIALDGLTTLAAQAYAPHLRVNGIAPGITLRSGDQTDDDYKIAHRRNPLRQGARLEDISRAAIMMLDTMAMTGHTVTIDGGLHLQPPSRDVAFLDG
ncbi:MAG: SDR family oxidoreductase [Alphaproteobacteria bacterium]|nr:SDR family oxidoreductase [Alphaproteobacteria bacterium]